MNLSYKKKKFILCLIIFPISFIIFINFYFKYSLSEEYIDREKYIELCPTKSFDKATIIFESVLICGTSKVSKEKIKYASNVVAVWLDNNRDGEPDNQIINDELKKQKATLIMTQNEPSLDFIIKVEMESAKKNLFTQDLYSVETNNSFRRDASGEETHHLITGAGWSDVFPQIFDTNSKNSKIYKAWKFSDEKGYYNYDDFTCYDDCKTMEHLYKSIAAYLNSSQDLADEEFTIKNKKELKEKLPQMIEIFESQKYNYPNKIWPNGEYNYSNNIKYLFLQ